MNKENIIENFFGKVKLNNNINMNCNWKCDLYVIYLFKYCWFIYEFFEFELGIRYGLGARDSDIQSYLGSRTQMDFRRVKSYVPGQYADPNKNILEEKKKLCIPTCVKLVYAPPSQSRYKVNNMSQQSMLSVAELFS